MESSKVLFQVFQFVFQMILSYRAAAGSCPQRCVCLNSTTLQISCEASRMTEIPREVSSSVSSLDMTRNSIESLGSTSFNALTNLVDLKLRENAIKTIPVGTFRSLNSLQILDLSSNNLTFLEKDVFRSAEKLVHLDLSNNQLHSVDKAFDGLTELTRLDLRENRLTSITHSTFRGLTQLRYLRLDDNRIIHIATRAFSDLERLMYFVIKGNPIGHLEGIFFSSQFLSYVDLSECGLVRVPKALPSSVRYLQLRRNKMAVLSRDAFSNCREVTIIVLDENDVIEIEEGTFQLLGQLQQLWLNGNLLEYVPRPLPPSVQRLFLDSNQIQSVTEDDFPRGSQINTLSLMSNNISHVSTKAFQRLSNLKSLDLSGNILRRIYGETFSQSSQLQSLQLSKNCLENLDSGSFHGLTQLRTLSMAYVPTDVYVHPDTMEDMVSLKKLDLDSSPGLLRNILDSDEVLSSLSSVQDLSIQNCEMTTLRPDFPDFFPNLAVLHVSSSALHCDSNLIWFRNWLLSASIHIEDRDRNRCLTPPALYDRALTSLSDEDFIPALHSNQLTRVPFDTSMENTASTHSRSTFNGRTKPSIPRVTSSMSSISFQSVSTPPGQVQGGHRYLNQPPTQPYPTSSIRKAASKPGAEMGTSVPEISETGILTWDEIMSRLSIADYEGKVFDANRHLDLFSSLFSSKHYHHGRHPEDRDTAKEPTSTVSLGSNLTVETTPLLSASSVVPPEFLFNGVTMATLTVLVTVVIAAALITFIVCLCRKRNSSAKHHPTENGISVHGGNGNQEQTKKDVMYFMTPTSSKHGDLGKPQAVIVDTENVREVMTLIPGRDVNHEGPMRVYKWEDF